MVWGSVAILFTRVILCSSRCRESAGDVKSAAAVQSFSGVTAAAGPRCDLDSRLSLPIGGTGLIPTETCGFSPLGTGRTDRLVTL